MTPAQRQKLLKKFERLGMDPEEMGFILDKAEAEGKLEGFTLTSERQKEYGRNYYATHKEQLREYQKKYYRRRVEEDPGFVQRSRDNAKNYYETHKERILAKSDEARFTSKMEYDPAWKSMLNDWARNRGFATYDDALAAGVWIGYGPKPQQRQDAGDTVVNEEDSEGVGSEVRRSIVRRPRGEGRPEHRSEADRERNEVEEGE